MFDFLIRTILIGAIATAALDLWNILLNRTGGYGLPNWQMAGRWVMNTLNGRPMQPDIANAPSFSNELAIGWVFHYAVGIVFAGALLMIWPGWAQNPTLLPALIVGWVTIGCGWFIMSPCLGGGMAHANREDPTTPRILNIAAHTVFGLALWIAGLALRAL